MNTNATATEIIATFANADEGVEAIVAKIATGYSVVLRDTDADEILPLVNIYPTAEKALAAAEKVAA